MLRGRSLRLLRLRLELSGGCTCYSLNLLSLRPKGSYRVAKEKNAKFIDVSLAKYSINDYSELYGLRFEVSDGTDKVKWMA